MDSIPASPRVVVVKDAPSVLRCSGASAAFSSETIKGSSKSPITLSPSEVDTPARWARVNGVDVDLTNREICWPCSPSTRRRHSAARGNRSWYQATTSLAPPTSSTCPSATCAAGSKPEARPNCCTPCAGSASCCVTHPVGAPCAARWRCTTRCRPLLRFATVRRAGQSRATRSGRGLQLFPVPTQ